MHNASHRLAENESEPQLPDPHTDLPATRALIGCVLSLLILWTLLGNFTVCAAVLRYRHLRAKVTNIFIVSLALSDLLVALLVMPWKAAAEVVGFWPFGAFCDTWVASDIMCSTASILNLCMISVDRYWAISSPFRYERKMNRRVAFVMVGVTWTVSVVISFVPVQLHWHRAGIAGITGSGDEFTRDVTGYNVSGVHQLHGAEEANGGVVEHWNCDSSLSRTYAISSSLISFYIPVVIMVVTYTRIYRIAQVQIRRISSLERAAEHAQNCRSDPHVAVDADGHRALRYSIRKETKVLKTLSVIMGVFVFCWFPFFLLNCAVPFCPGPGTASRTSSDPSPSSQLYCVSETTFDVFVWFGWSNSSLNPIIYAFNTEFREAFLRLLGCRGDNGCFGGWTTSATRVETVVLASNEAAGTEKKNSLDTTEMGVAYDTGCGAGRGSVTSGVIPNPVRGRALPTPLIDSRGAVTEPVCDCEVDPVRGRGDSRTPPATLTDRRGTITLPEPVCDCPTEDCKTDITDRERRTQMIPSHTF
ncbi:hypothetical protein J4Q44_G00038550 [Coregonus suidteri]|uniref:D(1B) dopamine receptor n=1 Tax=Coregonus suidteri TaxID=861788 RepID=A0AAN8R5D5_9TELE